jgi:sterol desaturase/sphingolipid hydroxylase (fatty acid hydroxylase superfamily)
MILTLIAGWYLYNLTEYFFHRIGHYPHKYNYIYHLHRKHHIAYPITDLLSDKYRGRGEGLIAFIPPTLILFYILCLLVSPITFRILLVELGSLTLISDFIHTQIHLKKSPLDRFACFNERRRIHLIHHQKFGKNFSFAGLSHASDKMFYTFEGRPIGTITYDTRK